MAKRNNKHQITTNKLEQLQAELKQLQDIERKKIADQLDDAREAMTDELEGLIPELLDEKKAIEIRIAKIKHIIANHQIIKKSNSKTIGIGATVSVKVNGRSSSYQIVESLEANPMEGKISAQSPIGKALMGHKEGDTAIATIGQNTINYKIEKVDYNG